MIKMDIKIMAIIVAITITMMMIKAVLGITEVIATTTTTIQCF